MDWYSLGPMPCSRVMVFFHVYIYILYIYVLYIIYILYIYIIFLCYIININKMELLGEAFVFFFNQPSQVTTKSPSSTPQLFRSHIFKAPRQLASPWTTRAPCSMWRLPRRQAQWRPVPWSVEPCGECCGAAYSRRSWCWCSSCPRQSMEVGNESEKNDNGPKSHR